MRVNRKSKILDWLAGIGVLTLSLAARAAQDALPPLRVPDGFVIERVAAPPQIRFPMFAAFDDAGRLYITESGGGDLYEELLHQKRTCRVSVLEDREGDGRFEAARVFAEQFVPSMGIAWRDGRLYVADPPDLVTLEDTDGDGRADRREVILSGFGHTDNGSLHGLEFGPDGWLYMTMGWPDGYHHQSRDGARADGKTGALLRCRPDGSGVQALARGFDQLVEVVFLPGGEMLGSQTWYQNPSGGIRDSLTHLVHGGFYPQRWPDEEPRVFVTGDTLPAVLLLPAIAHSGIAVYRGDQFPAEWRGQVFSAQFNTRAVVRHPLIRDGASFRSESHALVTTDDPDFRPADVIEDADGSLLILDTGSWYVQHCPTGRMRATSVPGAIYRVRRAGLKPPADPRGQKLEWNAASPDQIVARLGDARFAVRDRAVEWLVKRGQASVPALTKFLGSAGDLPASGKARNGRAGESPALPVVSRGPSDEAHTAAIWALARIGGEDAWRALRRGLEEAASRPAAAETNVASWDDRLCVLARALALRGDAAAAPALEKLLRHPSAPVRFAAAEALTVCGRAESSAALLQALAESPDRMLEHALVYTLHRHAKAGEMRAALERSNPAVQKAALLVLAQSPRLAATPNDVLTRLASTNEPLRRAAQYCLRSRPDWAAHAVDFIRQEIRAPELPAPREAALLQLLHAFHAQPALASSVAGALREPDTVVSVARKTTLLGFMAQSALAGWPEEWTDALAAVLRHPAGEVQVEAIRAAGAAGTSLWDATLWDIARGGSADHGARVEALAVLARRQPQLDGDAFAFLASQLHVTNTALGRLRAAEVFAGTQPPADALRALVAAARDDASISPSLVLAAAKRAGVTPETAAPLLEYLAASVERGWGVGEAQLDWVLKAAPESARAAATELARAIRNQAEQQQALLREYEPLLAGGDAARGRDLFFGKAQCFTCHTVADQGRPVGPDLTKVGAIRSGRDILESVLLPGATFAQGYDTYVAETKDGESVSGSLARETPEWVVLRNASGAEARLRRNEIVSLEKSRLSMMPEGLLQALTRGEAADLLAFLRELK
jgi:putative membrane-bound dehydrogenase-like protein